MPSKEIFQQVGPVKNAIVHYDQEGRSVGTAEVTFKNKGSAEKAVEEYDRVSSRFGSFVYVISHTTFWFRPRLMADRCTFGFKLP